MMATSSGPSHTPGPSVHLPGKFPKFDMPMGMGPQYAGYTPAHGMQQSYPVYNAEVVTVKVRVVLMLSKSA